MKLSIKIACLALAVFSAALSVAQDKKGSYTKTGTFGLVEYDYPAFLASPTITTTTLADGRKEIKFQFSEAFVPAANNISLEVYFDAIAGGSKFDRAVVAALGAYTYKSAPQITAGNAGVIKIADFTKVGAAEVQVDGSAVYLRYSPSLVNNAAHNAILFRYLPSSVAMTNLADDLNSVMPVKFFLAPEFTSGSSRALKVPTPKLDGAVTPPPPGADYFFSAVGIVIGSQIKP